MNNNPFMPLFEQLGIAQRPTGPAAVPPPIAPPEPQLSPYEARIKMLMDKRGWSREDAVANQQNALGLGTDYNNDGAVSNDEWAKFGETPQGMAYIRKHPGPQRQGARPQAPGMPNMTPEQMAALQKFNGYGRGSF